MSTQHNSVPHVRSYCCIYMKPFLLIGSAIHVWSANISRYTCLDIWLDHLLTHRYSSPAGTQMVSCLLQMESGPTYLATSRIVCTRMAPSRCTCSSTCRGETWTISRSENIWVWLHTCQRGKTEKVSALLEKEAERASGGGGLRVLAAAHRECRMHDWAARGEKAGVPGKGWRPLWRSKL